MNADEIRNAFEELCARQVDGIVILVPLDLDMDFIRSARGEIPFIAIDVDLGLDLPAVLVDQGTGSLLAIRHVTALGHRRIAFICGPIAPLSTIYQDFAALGETGVEYLLDMINRPNAEPKRYVLKPVLVSRKSTKALG